MTIEKRHGVHSKERSQANRKLSTAKQYAQHHKINNSPYVETSVTEDLGSHGKVKVLKRC